MNETQQQIFDQYIAWLFDGGDDVQTALDGLRQIAPPEAVDPLIRFIKYAHVRYAERWTYAHYQYWNTNIEMAFMALGAIYLKAEKEPLETGPKSVKHLYETVLVVTDKDGNEVAPDDFYWIGDFMAIGERRQHDEYSIWKDLREITETGQKNV